MDFDTDDEVPTIEIQSEEEPAEDVLKLPAMAGVASMADATCAVSDDEDHDGAGLSHLLNFPDAGSLGLGTSSPPCSPLTSASATPDSGIFHLGHDFGHSEPGLPYSDPGPSVLAELQETIDRTEREYPALLENTFNFLTGPRFNEPSSVGSTDNIFNLDLSARCGLTASSDPTGLLDPTTPPLGTVSEPIPDTSQRKKRRRKHKNLPSRTESHSQRPKTRRTTSKMHAGHGRSYSPYGSPSSHSLLLPRGPAPSTATLGRDHDKPSTSRLPVSALTTGPPHPQSSPIMVPRRHHGGSPRPDSPSLVKRTIPHIRHRSRSSSPIPDTVDFPRPRHGHTRSSSDVFRQHVPHFLSSSNLPSYNPATNNQFPLRNAQFEGDAHTATQSSTDAGPREGPGPSSVPLSSMRTALQDNSSSDSEGSMDESHEKAEVNQSRRRRGSISSSSVASSRSSVPPPPPPHSSTSDGPPGGWLSVNARKRASLQEEIRPRRDSFYSEVGSDVDDRGGKRPQIRRLSYPYPSSITGNLTYPTSSLAAHGSFSPSSETYTSTHSPSRESSRDGRVPFPSASPEAPPFREGNHIRRHSLQASSSSILPSEPLGRRGLPRRTSLLVPERHPRERLTRREEARSFDGRTLPSPVISALRYNSDTYLPPVSALTGYAGPHRRRESYQETDDGSVYEEDEDYRSDVGSVRSAREASSSYTAPARIIDPPRRDYGPPSAASSAPSNSTDAAAMASIGGAVVSGVGLMANNKTHYRAVGSKNIDMASERRRKGEKKYKCRFEDCNKMFTTNQNRQIHQWKHTGEKPYRCGCGYGSASRSDLRRHLNRKSMHSTCKELPVDQEYLNLLSQAVDD
ncbi:hypothetical protein CC1G_11886 [Coprinopsis cinerea okayama7|uniref:C2H2-type domain-containing protein n=1 Tax=Coprinopsis cinerea (strain Okayama-7 / 130 / ATCC MYA-4618 / FGSC 9003) TaxID=240176 RepID=A8P3J6_COPC7|nr:hypothetical protein CC1G_11886 [Coprinopsis cinerea okayama7\|eukprot:XP_001838557.2 hypothetical protein CC1G_11886 [Coprinopsis cinerea okayama7\